MSITINTVVFDADRIGVDSVSYVAPDHTLSNENSLVLGRTYPKEGGLIGVARPTAKLTRTVTVNVETGAIARCILRIEGSIPIGTPDTDIAALLADAADFLGTAEASDLFEALAINH